MRLFLKDLGRCIGNRVRDPDSRARTPFVCLRCGADCASPPGWRSVEESRTEVPDRELSHAA
jgi:hypothetical protein